MFRRSVYPSPFDTDGNELKVISMRCAAAAQPKPRHGVTSVLAMLYLVLFACMAVGFYSASGTAVEVSQNEQEQAISMGDAESGMDFIRFQLAQISIPPNSTGPTLMNSIYTQLSANLNGTPNMLGNSVQLDAGVVT